MDLIERGQRSDSEPGVLLADRLRYGCCLLFAAVLCGLFFVVFFMNKCEEIQQCPLIFMF